MVGRITQTITIMKKLSFIFLILFSLVGLFSCEKYDPFVDRTVSPVLVVFEPSIGGSTSGLTTDPTISASFTGNAKFGIRILELDKTNILDYTKGIDSIPVPGVELVLKFRNGAEISKISTDNAGLASVDIPWSSLGIIAKGGSSSLSVSSSFKEQSFTKLFKVSAK